MLITAIGRGMMLIKIAAGLDKNFSTIGSTLVRVITAVTFAFLAVYFIVESRKSSTPKDKYLKIILFFFYSLISCSFIFVPVDYIIIPAVLGVIGQFLANLL